MPIFQDSDYRVWYIAINDKVDPPMRVTCYQYVENAREASFLIRRLQREGAELMPNGKPMFSEITGEIGFQVRKDGEWSEWSGWHLADVTYD